MFGNCIWHKLFLILVLSIIQMSCGEEGQMTPDEEPPPSVITISNDDQACFWADGVIEFETTYSGSGEYRFDLWDLSAGNSIGVIAIGSGPSTWTSRSDDLPNNYYKIETDNLSGWSIQVKGDVFKCGGDGICTDFIANIRFNTCLNHGGTDTIKGCDESFLPGRIVCEDDYISDTTCSCD